MYNIIQELKQFGLRKVNSSDVKINANYLIMDMTEIRSNDNFDSIFLEDIENLMSENIFGKVKVINENKIGNPKKVKTKQSKRPCPKICSYIKFIGKYVGRARVYKKNYEGGYSDDEDEDEDYSDKEEVYKLSGEYKNSYEYTYGKSLFAKNGNMTLYDHNDSSSILFEVDECFDEMKFLGIILLVCANVDYERDKMLKVVCSNQEITLRLIYREFPKDYKRELAYKSDKKYSLDKNFVFFK